MLHGLWINRDILILRKPLIEVEYHIPSISMYFHHNVSVPSLLQMEASHLDLASLDNTYPELSSEVITEVSIHPVKQDNQRISSEFSTQNHQD